MAFESTYPATGEVWARYEGHTPAQVEACLARAEGAARHWASVPFAERAQVIGRVGAILNDRADEWARLMTREMGKPVAQARAEARKSAWVAAHYAEHTEALLAGREIAAEPGMACRVRYAPLGVLLGIMPWNFPFWQVLRFAVPALMAGNVALLKHASNVPGSALAIEAIFREAGLPEGCLQALLVGGAQAEALIADRRVAAVTLTGSEGVGRRVGAAAGQVLKPCVLELGGSDPFVVLADADVAKAAEVAAHARLQNNGQSCIAAKRFIVERPVVEVFLDRFSRALSVAPMGDPLDERTVLGPLARADLRDDLHRQVRATRDEGAALLLGGGVRPGPGFFYPATLLADVLPTHTAAREETFGPVAVVITASGAAEALELANASVYGLGASIWTRDLERGRALAARIDAGMVFVNGLVRSDPRLPFGGVKDSGFGRELAEEGVRAFTNVKTVVVEPA